MTYLCFLAALGLAFFLRPSAALLACLICCLALPPLSWGLLHCFRAKIGLSLCVPSVAQKGEAVTLRAECRAPRALRGRVSVTMHVENPVTGEAETIRVRCGVPVTLQSAFCGCLQCDITRARLWEPLGLLPVPLKCRASGRITVLPQLFPVEIQMDSAPAQSEDSKQYAQDRRGDDRTETYQLRDYAAGDSLRLIHWKLSAKRERLIVREAACPVDRSLLLFVERTLPNATATQADALMEAAASIAQGLAQQGIPFRLCWNEDTIRTQSVADAAALPEAFGALLRSRTAASGERGCEQYLRLCGAPTAGRVIYLGMQPPEADFAQAAPCKALLCDNRCAALSAQALRILSWS